MKITRFCYGPEGTFSQATIGGQEFFFCELPWNNNKAYESCIPEGTYGIKRDVSGQHKGFELTNVPSRSQIEVHVGNTIMHTEGCLLVGLGLGYVNGRWAVANSRAAIVDLRNALKKDGSKQVTIASVFKGAG
jgi:hypothetical protein